MKTLIWITMILGFGVGLAATAGAHSTINSVKKYKYGANIGWFNCRHNQPGPVDGLAVGEFVCEGFVYGANVGWVNFGDGSPTNGIQYQNNSASDFGVNLTGHVIIGPSCEVKLRGFAYGANIGWINFENLGDPRINLATGEFKGYAYSANCGWINLGEGGMTPLKTDTILEGTDSDVDGIPDAYELTHAGNLGAMDAVSDLDGDGISDLKESIADTDPNDADDRLKVTVISGGGSGATTDITFTSRPTRKYSIQKTDLSASFVDAGMGVFAPDAGATTTKTLPAVANVRQYYRPVAQKPLAP